MTQNIGNAGLGEVTFSKDGKINTGGAVPFVDAKLLTPYGMAVAMPIGEQVFMLPIGNTTLCMGTVQNTLTENLQAGEIMLYSAGGASIVLKNDGRVLINGREV